MVGGENQKDETPDKEKEKGKDRMRRREEWPSRMRGEGGGSEWECCPASAELVPKGYWCLIVQKIASPFGPAFKFDEPVVPVACRVDFEYFLRSSDLGMSPGRSSAPVRTQEKGIFPTDDTNRG